MRSGAVAVLTAAGSGARLGLGFPKALAELAGCSLVGHAASRLCATGLVTGIVVTAPVEHLPAFHAALSAAGLTVPWQVVPGGASRQASVAAGLAALEAARDEDQHYDVVLVHDAARPLAPAAMMRAIIAAVRSGHPAVVPGLAVTDTIVRVAADDDVAHPATDADDVAHPAATDADDVPQARAVASAADPADPAAPAVLRAAGTVDRAALRAVQTPQGFAWDLLRRAHAAGAARAGDEATAATDDSTLVAALGEHVWIVEGDTRAMKITTAQDLALAQILVLTEES